MKGINLPAHGSISSIKPSCIGEFGDPKRGIRIVRLIANYSLSPQLAAQSVEAAVPYIEDFHAQLLITPGAFGLAELPGTYKQNSEKGTHEAVQEYVTDFLQLIPSERNFDIILGVDGGKDGEGWLQDAYFIPSIATTIEDCQRVWKSYPTSDDVSYLYTMGRACPCRVVNSYGMKICILVCHDLAAFSNRSKATRGTERERWAEPLESEVARGGNTGIVHLIHYLKKPNSGLVFANGMKNLVNEGVGWGLSTFRTPLDPHSNGFKKLQERTARFAGPTLDIYV